MTAAPQPSTPSFEPGVRIELSSTAATIWEMLAASFTTAAAAARHPLHLLTVATVDGDGCPHARTVVLRGFDADRREIRFHTDARSPKTAQIAATGRVALHWYDATSRLQIRITARATLHQGDDVAQAGWRGSQPMSRACYFSPDAPGTHIDAFPPAPPPPTATERDLVPATFVVVCCRFSDVELLSLHAAGHERVRLRLDGPQPIRDILAP